MNTSTAKKITLSALIILGVLLTVGAVYTWFAGQTEVKIASTVPAPKTDPNPIKPSKPDPNAAESAAVEVLSSPVKPGDNAVITVKTYPLSTCTITVTYGTSRSTDSGLAPKKANAFGIVNWSWTVDATAPVGTWPVDVSCSINAKNAVVRGDQTVTN